MYDNRFCGPGGCPPLMKMRRAQKRRGLFYKTRLYNSLPQIPLPMDISVPAPAGAVMNDMAPVRQIDPVRDRELVDYLEQKYDRPISKQMLASLSALKRRREERAVKIAAKAASSREKLPQTDPVSALNEATRLSAKAAVEGNFLKRAAEEGIKAVKQGYKVVKNVFRPKQPKRSKNSSNMFLN